MFARELIPLNAPAESTNETPSKPFKLRGWHLLIPLALLVAGCTVCVIFGGLLFSATAFDNVKADVEEITVRFQDKNGRTITPGAASILNPTGTASKLHNGNIAIALDLEVQNKNIIKLDVQKVNYKVYVNDTFIGKGSRPKKGKPAISIPAGGLHTTSVKVKTPTKKVFGKASSILTRGKLDIVVKGYAKTSILGISLTRSFKVKHTHNYSPVKKLPFP